MSLKPTPIQPVPEETARVARAAFPKGNPYLRLRDELGAIFARRGLRRPLPQARPAGTAPWRLALVTVLQFRENLTDRQAAEAVRARIDWKYLLGLELDDPGFDHSVLCEFRARLLAGGAEELLLDKLLDACQARACSGRAAGSGPTSTRVLAAIRALNRLELVGETLRPALNELATVAPDWLRGVAPAAWYGRYAQPGRGRPPAAAPRPSARPTPAPSARTASRCSTCWTRPEAPEGLRELPAVGVLRRVWARQFVREDGAPPEGGVRRRGEGELPPERATAVESPVRPRGALPHPPGTAWVGYIVHLTETCDDDARHLITHAMTTAATVHEARCTAAIHAALAGRGLVPGEHLVDAAYVDAELLVASREGLGIDLVGPPRPNPSLAGPRPRAATPPTASRSTGTRSGRAARRASRRAAGAGGSTGTARPTSRSGSARRTAPPARRGPCAPATGQARQLRLHAAGGVRGADGGAAAARDQGGPARLRAAGRDRGHDLARGARLRPAPEPLPRAGQDPPAARGDRGRDRPPAPRRLVPGGPARRHPHLPLRRPRDGLSRLRQR